MRCPYCASDIAAEALVCAQCRRDLYLLKPLMEKIRELEGALAEQEKTTAAGYQARIAELEAQLAQAQRAAPPSRARSYAASVLVATLPALLLLIAAHGVLLFVYDAKPLYLRIASVLLPLPFGFALLVWHPARLWRSALAGCAMALAAVAGMLLLTASIDNVPALPQNAREWREVLEYALSIGLAFFTGLLLGKWRYHRLQRAPQPGRLALFIAQLFTANKDGEFGIERIAKRVQRLSHAATPAAAGAASIYAGIKSILGAG